MRDFGNVQEKVTDMVIRHYVTESIVYMLASNMDKGVKDYQLEAAIGKVVSSVIILIFFKLIKFRKMLGMFVMKLFKFLVSIFNLFFNIYRRYGFYARSRLGTCFKRFADI